MKLSNTFDIKQNVVDCCGNLSEMRGGLALVFNMMRTIDLKTPESGYLKKKLRMFIDLADMFRTGSDDWPVNIC